MSTQHPGHFFFAAYTAAIERLRDLLASLDQACAGQANLGGNPPHAYIPTWPVEAAPYLGYCPPEVRQEAFRAVLEGVETGAYDMQIVKWLTGWDDPTCRTMPEGEGQDTGQARDAAASLLTCIYRVISVNTPRCQLRLARNFKHGRVSPE